MKTESLFFASLVTLLISITGLLFHASKMHESYRVNHHTEAKRYKIGLLVMATGKRYLEAAHGMIESARKYFCTHHQVTYFIFTDTRTSESPDIIVLPQEQMGWPYDSIMRFATYHKYREYFKEYDYLFSCDADMQFVDNVGDEILDSLVGTIHPQVRFKPRGYEDNPLSTACLHKGQATHYFAGAFYGGARNEFLQLIDTLQNNIIIDLARGYVARVNDESHLNYYFAHHKPTTLLGPEYCHFEGSYSPYKPKLVALSSLDVDKKFMRKKAPCTPLDYYVKLLIAQL